MFPLTTVVRLTWDKRSSLLCCCVTDKEKRVFDFDTRTTPRTSGLRYRDQCYKTFLGVILVIGHLVQLSFHRMTLVKHLSAQILLTPNQNITVLLCYMKLQNMATYMKTFFTNNVETFLRMTCCCEDSFFVEYIE
jgi:hypothetical protein